MKIILKNILFVVLITVTFFANANDYSKFSGQWNGTARNIAGFSFTETLTLNVDSFGNISGTLTASNNPNTSNVSGKVVDSNTVLLSISPDGVKNLKYKLSGDTLSYSHFFFKGSFKKAFTSKNRMLDNCLEQYYPDNSKDVFVIRNACNNIINIKYTYSKSKPFSGTYTTLRPREQTFETGKGEEKIKFNYCIFPQVPQTLEDGCV